MFGTSNYVSCIKINGIRILPPLITEERLKDLREDKQKAIEIENRLHLQRILKTQVKDRIKQTSLEHKLSFGDLENNNVEEIVENSNNNNECNQNVTCQSPVPLNEVDEGKQGCKSSTKKLHQKYINLSRNIIDVSQYNSDGVVVFDTEEESESCQDCDSIKNLSIDNIRPLESTEIDNKGNSETRTETEEDNKIAIPKSPLIRSDSYILETPSPILVQYIREQDELQNNDSNYLDKCTSSVRQALFRADINSSSFNGNEDDLVQEISNLQVGDKSESLQPANVEENLTDETNKSNIASSCDNSLNCTEETNVENYRMDVSSQYIFQGSVLNGLMELLEQYKKQCIAKTAPRDNSADVPSIRIEELMSPIKENFEQIDSDSSSNENSITIESCSQTIYSVCSNEAIGTVHNSNANFSCTLNSSELLNYIYTSTDSGQIDPEDMKTARKLREKWAAGVITAATKGFLVRRLQRTDKVQNLKQTIQDALLCAVSLHTEQEEAIQPADVELHRRLIQQVSAACYAFHDIFFKLSTKEQMSIIARDREIQKEKLKRSLSASSTSSTLNHSSSRSNTRIKSNTIVGLKRRRDSTAVV